MPVTKRSLTRLVMLCSGFLAVPWIAPGPALGAEDEKPQFRFVQISDTHCMLPEGRRTERDFGGRVYSRSLEILGGAMGYIDKQVRPAFLIHTGDIVENGGWADGLEQMGKAKSLLAAARVPVFPVFGNHEVSEERYEEVFGLGDYWYRYGNMVFVHLKVLHRYPALQIMELAVPKHVLYQLDDLLTHVGRTANVVITMHEPLVCHKNEQRWARPGNHELVIKILQRHPNVLMVLQGHTHFWYRESRKGIEYVICPGLVNSSTEADKSLGHAMLVYGVYADRIECRLHGAPSTDEAVKGNYRRSASVHFALPLKRKLHLPEGAGKGLRPRSLPNACNRYDVEIEHGMNPVAFYLFEGWRFRADPNDEGKTLGWHQGEFDDSKWKPNKAHYLRNPWEVYLARDYDGVAWYRIRFAVPEPLKHEKLRVILGPVDDSDETYLNGSPIGRTGAFPPGKADPDSRKVSRRYDLPDKLLRYGQQNVLAVRVYDAGGSGGMLGLPYVKILRTSAK